MSAISDELDYLEFRKAKRHGSSASMLAAYFGSRAAEKMEARYQADLAAGLIQISYHDDAQPCGVCGAKHCRCAPMTRSEWRRECR